MINSLGVPQTLLLLGGTSDIGLAVAETYARQTRRLRVILAARPSARRDEALSRMQDIGADARVVDFDALDTESHPEIVQTAGLDRDIDLAIVAFGVLSDGNAAHSHAEVMRLAQTNYVGALSVGACLGEQVRAQGHGVIVALSSVAGERVRRSNYAYGSTKAGMDAYYIGLGEHLRGHGGHVLVVRPGFVHSKMTIGRRPAPLAASVDDVAKAVIEGVNSRRAVVWVPASLRPVMSTLRHVPRRVFRRLPI